MIQSAHKRRAPALPWHALSLQLTWENFLQPASVYCGFAFKSNEIAVVMPLEMQDLMALWQAVGGKYQNGLVIIVGSDRSANFAPTLLQNGLRRRFSSPSGFYIADPVMRSVKIIHAGGFCNGKFFCFDAKRRNVSPGAKS